jgi:hypothetical protein
MKRRRLSQHLSEVLPAPVQVVEETVPITTAETPQDLVYAILTSKKEYFSKQELLEIITKLDAMQRPTFPYECSYIG